MAKRVSAVPFPPLTLDPTAPVPVYRQIYDGLRAAILAGRLAPGAQLPSTRTLATGLGIARTTVVAAFAQLLAEGYLDGKVGAGTYVARELPDDLLHARIDAAPTAGPARATRLLSRRGELLATTPASGLAGRGAPRAFRPGVPALDAFPCAVWARLVTQCWRHPPHGLLGYNDPAGYQPLREAIATYLGAARAVHCDPAQVIVVAGSQQGLDLVARVLLDPGEAVWIEDPGYLGARGALLGAGAALVPVPVDAEGLDVAAGVARCPDARLAYVTPSHQYPLGVTMSLARRLALLDWAARSGAWVLEDDYDSEYRYAGRPLAALQGLDTAGRVIYLGTFSKVLSPALRLGYLVVPPALVDAMAAGRALMDFGAPAMSQAVLAEFMAQGHFARHIRRMRAIYAERQGILVDAVRRELAGRVEVRPADAGMHLIGRLVDGTDDRAAAAHASGYGIELPPSSVYSLTQQRSDAVLLGYTAFNGQEITQGIRTLALALRDRGQSQSGRRANSGA